MRLQDPRGDVTFDNILSHVGAEFNVPVRQLKGHRRDRVIARPRQVAMYLALQLTCRSTPEIGRLLGGRDHTTVMHGEKKIVELLETDSDLRESVTRLMELVSIGASPRRHVSIKENINDVARRAMKESIAYSKAVSGRESHGPLNLLRQFLREGWHETVVVTATERDGATINLMVSPEGTWTMISYEGDQAAIIGAGTNWQSSANVAKVVSSPKHTKLDGSCPTCGCRPQITQQRAS